MKKMINWDFFTHPKDFEFNSNTSATKKQILSQKWKDYMQKNDCWLSFY